MILSVLHPAFRRRLGAPFRGRTPRNPFWHRQRLAERTTSGSGRRGAMRSLVDSSGSEHSMPSDARVVLITGASSGVGRSTAALLSQNGYRVLGTSRNPVAAQDPAADALLALDVRSDESVAACVR